MRLLPLFVFALAGTSILGQGFPDPKPGKPHQLLAQQEGTWDFELKMFVQGPDQPPLVAKGTEVNTLLGGGLFLQTKIQCKFGDKPFEVNSLLGFDMEIKKYTGVWVDSFTTTPTMLTGELDEKTKVFTVFMKIKDETGNTLVQKNVTTFPAPGVKKGEAFMLDANGKALGGKFMEINATKRKAADVKRKAQEVGQAVFNGDFDKLVKLTYPKAIEVIGGRDKMIAVTAAAMAEMKERGILFRSLTVGDASPFLTEGGNTFTILPTTVEMTIPGGKVVGQSYLLGISEDGGKTWAFVDGSGLVTQKQRDQVLPTLPANLKLPEKQNPRVQQGQGKDRGM